MFSISDRSPPVVCFVGRPLDPLKGLITFLDAIERVLALPTPPTFSVWIVGGDADEMGGIDQLLSTRPRLNVLVVAGRILLWGKVARHSLPEIYRRCAVLVMPSLREQFGLVAIEAMACGVPVIGTRQGGLDDTILAGLTGTKAEIDQPEAIAAALLLYLRGPNIRTARSRLARSWAAGAFDKAHVYSRMAELYTGDVPAALETPSWDLPDRFHAAEVESRVTTIEVALGQRITAWTVASARYHVIARVETEAGLYAVKVFRDRPSLSAALFPPGAVFAERTAGDFVDNALFHAGNPQVPRLVAADRDSGVAIYNWLDLERAEASPANLRAVRKAFANYGEEQLSCPQEQADYSDAVRAFLAHRDAETLAALDQAAVALNRAAQSIGFCQRLAHPAAELQRILICLETQGWPIPVDVSDRIRMVTGLLQNKWNRPGDRPKLCHGDLKSRHLMSTGGSLLVLDTEHSTFAIGELDLGTFAADQLASGQNIANVAAALREATDSVDDATSALQWMYYFLIHGYLARVHHGKVTESATFIRRVLMGLALTLN